MLKLIRENRLSRRRPWLPGELQDLGDGGDGFPREVAEIALAHITRDAAERAYERSDLFEQRRELMQAWAGYLAGQTGAAVVPLRGRQS